jgi:uncharacterized protein (DUF488 family)
VARLLTVGHGTLKQSDLAGLLSGAGVQRLVDVTAALQAVLADAEQAATAVLCSESLWWRCHRRLIADAAVLLHDTAVVHLLHDGRLTLHGPTDGVRRDGERLVYAVDGAADQVPQQRLSLG